MLDILERLRCDLEMLWFHIKLLYYRNEGCDKRKHKSKKENDGDIL